MYRCLHAARCAHEFCDHEFCDTQQGHRSHPAPRFDPSASVIAKARGEGAVNQWRAQAARSVEEARSHLTANYPRAECNAIARVMQVPAWLLLGSKGRRSVSPHARIATVGLPQPETQQKLSSSSQGPTLD